MSERLDPLSFAGCFAELDSDLPAGIRLADWRSVAAREVDEGAGPAVGRVPQGCTRRVRWWARRPRAERGPDTWRTR
jgi:hypothetical protein